MELKERLATLYGDRLRGVYLYGAYARGEFREDSDVDVLIVLAGRVGFQEEISRYSAAVSGICLRHDVLIATIPISEEWFVQRHEPFFVNARRDGMLVFWSFRPRTSLADPAVPTSTALRARGCCRPGHENRLTVHRSAR